MKSKSYTNIRKSDIITLTLGNLLLYGMYNNRFPNVSVGF